MVTGVQLRPSPQTSIRSSHGHKALGSLPRSVFGLKPPCIPRGGGNLTPINAHHAQLRLVFMFILPDMWGESGKVMALELGHGECEDQCSSSTTVLTLPVYMTRYVGGVLRL